MLCIGTNTTTSHWFFIWSCSRKNILFSLSFLDTSCKIMKKGVLVHHFNHWKLLNMFIKIRKVTVLWVVSTHDVKPYVYVSCQVLNNVGNVQLSQLSHVVVKDVKCTFHFIKIDRPFYLPRSVNILMAFCKAMCQMERELEQISNVSRS